MAYNYLVEENASDDILELINDAIELIKKGEYKHE